MDEREALIAAWLDDPRPSIVELAEMFGISEKTAHKWITRFREFQCADALRDRSRRPHSSPNRTEESIRLLVIAERRACGEGPKKIVARLARRYPELELPAPSTVGTILKAEELIRTRRRRRPRVVDATPERFAPVEAPNDLWSMDHKGQFTVERRGCYPLTATDAYSRFLLACHGCPSTAEPYAVSALTRAFREYGLPARIRSDNGPPFGSVGIGGLSKLTVLLTKLGIRQEFITPGKPQENGRHERMHRTLKAATALPAASTWEAQQSRFDNFRRDFNFERPHEALGMKVPAELYRPSARHFPARIPKIEYSTSFAVRRVRHTGEIKWNGRLIYVSQTLAGESVGLAEDDADGWWRLYFGSWDLGLVTHNGTLIQRKRAVWTSNPGSPMSPV